MKGKLQTITMTKDRVMAMFPVDKEPKITTLDKPLIIQSSCPGWQMGGARFPAVPCTIEEQARELADSVKAGSVVIHVHPRDPKTCLAQISTALLKEVLDATFDKVGDCVTFPAPADMAADATCICGCCGRWTSLRAARSGTTRNSWCAAAVWAVFRRSQRLRWIVMSQSRS